MQLMESIRRNGRVAATALSLVFWALVMVHSAGGAPPPNDGCVGAIVIPSTSFPYLTAVLSNVNEATLVGDPSPSCIIGAARGVWYSFTPSQSGVYTFSTGNDTETTAFDTILAVIAAANCGDGMIEVACNDDSGAPNNRAGLEASLTGGTHYYVLVWLSQADDESGPLSVQLRVDRPQPPANGTCATAEIIPSNLGLPRWSSTNETIRATPETNEFSCATGYRGVWYTFTPQTTNTYIFSTGNDTVTTMFDTVMVLYRATNDCIELIEEACSDNGEGRGSLFRTLNGGTTYYIAIYDESRDPIVSETVVQLSVSTPTPPSATTLALESITSSSAVLSGIVNPNGLQARVWFEWGLTTAYTSTSSVRLLFPGTAPITTNTTVTGFLPNTTYHYRIVANNSLGRTDGLDRTFIWKTNQPALATPERFPSGNVRLSFAGNSRQVYAVQTSTNLTEWTQLGLATEAPADSGSFIYTHIGAGAALRRFYRVYSP
jgi:hypothetical protein